MPACGSWSLTCHMSQPKHPTFPTTTLRVGSTSGAVGSAGRHVGSARRGVGSDAGACWERSTRCWEPRGGLLGALDAVLGAEGGLLGALDAVLGATQPGADCGGCDM